MTGAPRVTMIPLVGPFHTRFPLYNTVHVREVVAAAAPEALALASLPPGALEEPGWQATPELALPHTVVPWARRRGLPLHEVGSAVGAPGEPGSADDAEEFARFLSDFEVGRAHLRQVQAALAPVERLLAGALDLTRIMGELLPAIAEYEAARKGEYGEGPGTGWAEERAARMAARVTELPYEHVALLVGVDDLTALRAALAPRAELADPPLPPAALEEARERALLDVAMRGEVDDPGALLGQLRGVDSAESRYHQANLLLANAHVAEALELLKGVASGDFQEPYYLPGFVLARLGQLFDLSGDRTAALRAYRGALALSFAPPEAAEAALQGVAEPFGWPQEAEGAAPGEE